MSFNVLNSFGVGESYQYFNYVGPGTSQTQSSVTGEWVILGSVLVPTGFFLSGDVVTVESVCTKSGTVDTWNLGMFINTSASLNSAKLIGYCMNNKPDNSSLTYSFILRRLHIVETDGSGDGTKVFDYDWRFASGTASTHDHYAYGSLGEPFTYNRIGQNGTYSTSTGVMSGISTTSPNWGGVGHRIIIAGYTANFNSSPIRCEWIKVSGKAEGDGTPVS